MSKREPISSLAEVDNGKFYGVVDLQNILKELGLNYSIFSIMNAETWHCLNYECSKRFHSRSELDSNGRCSVCHSEVSTPIIESPRTKGGRKGQGHRRYSGNDLKRIVQVFSQ